jgi:hypothetical protein
MSKNQLQKYLESFLILLLTFLGSFFSQTSYADEGGSPFWLSGQYASMAAVPSSPGWSLVAMPYFYSGKVSQSKVIQRGENLTVGMRAKQPLLLLQLGYSSEKKILGAQPYIGVGWGPGAESTSAFASVNPGGYGLNRSNSVTGGSDIFPLASLSWNKGNNNYMTYITGNIPTGTYSPSSLATVGLGHAAVDVGGGYTYLNGKTGLEFSGVLGATYNFMNKQTNYKSGIDSHLDWSLSQFFSSSWQAGIAGYVYYQLTGDSGSGDNVGAFKSQVAGVGPQIGYLFNMNKKQAYINLRAYKEFWAKNRLEGYTVIATISLPLGK